MTLKAFYLFICAVALLFAAASLLAGCSGANDDDSDDSEPQDDTVADDDSAADDADDDMADDSVADDDTAVPIDLLDYVNPFVGTGGVGYAFSGMMPGPMVPNGMVKLSADTSVGPVALTFMHFGGYYYADNSIRGFSHMHLPGTGSVDMGNINLMPVMGISDLKVVPAGYLSRFRHKDEEARPGYYSVLLERYNIRVELASTMNAGLHRYTFPEGGGAPHVIIDVTYAIEDGTSAGADVTVDQAAGEVYGYDIQSGSFAGRYGGLPIYFVIRFSEPITDAGVFSNNARQPSQTHASGADIGAYAGFAEGTTSLLAKVGLSLVDVDQARANLDAQIPAWDFDAVVEASRQAWRDRLSDVIVEGGTETQRRIFYTALYHLYAMPTSLTEEGGVYEGFDRASHQADGFTYYSDLSIWDTFRTFHPAMTLLRPSLSRDFVISLLMMYEQGGAFPRWPQGIGDSGSMIGTHSDSIITEAYIKGITDFDVETAYQGLYAHATGPVPYGDRGGLNDWINLGYVASDHDGGSVSKTVEYAYDDFCLSELADRLGKTADRDMFAARALQYANVWDPETLFFRARDSAGQFKPADQFMDWWLNYDEYVEGNARHWRWFVPHDVPGLIDLFGGPETFAAELDRFMSRGRYVERDFLPNLFYWQGNEPDIQAPFMFNDAGRPDLTALWSRWVMDHRFGDQADGIDGNDDGGAMSAWYVFSALGLFPVAPCTDVYYVGSPIFTKATVRVGDNTLVITAQNASDQNIYVQSATLNGEPLDVPFVHHGDIAAGGALDFVMGPEPSDWGK